MSNKLKQMCTCKRLAVVAQNSLIFVAFVNLKANLIISYVRATPAFELMGVHSLRWILSLTVYIALQNCVYWLCIASSLLLYSLVVRKRRHSQREFHQIFSLYESKGVYCGFNKKNLLSQFPAILVLLPPCTWWWGQEREIIKCFVTSIKFSRAISCFSWL